MVTPKRLSELAAKAEAACQIIGSIRDELAASGGPYAANVTADHAATVVRELMRHLDYLAAEVVPRPKSGESYMSESSLDPSRLG